MPGAQVCREPREESVAGWAQEGPSLPALLPWLRCGECPSAPPSTLNRQESTWRHPGAERMSQKWRIALPAGLNCSLLLRLPPAKAPTCSCDHLCVLCLQGTPSQGEDESKRQDSSLARQQSAYIQKSLQQQTAVANSLTCVLVCVVFARNAIKRRRRVKETDIFQPGETAVCASIYRKACSSKQRCSGAAHTPLPRGVKREQAQ